MLCGAQAMSAGPRHITILRNICNPGYIRSKRAAFPPLFSFTPLSYFAPMASNKMSQSTLILNDLQSLSNSPFSCRCSSEALRRVVLAYRIADIQPLARRFRDPVILALEYRQQGSRLFVATSRQHVFHYLCFLRIQRPQYNTWHEILTDLTPLRLYFDIDFYFKTNRLDVHTLLGNFCQLLVDILRDYFHWRNGQERNIRFIQLDATTEEKFSRHVIVRMENLDGSEVVFSHPKEIREFVYNNVVNDLRKNGFFIRPKPGMPDNGNGVPLIDLLVYNEKPGQNFRLLGSPKFGLHNTLRFVAEYDFHVFGFHSPNCTICEGMFLDSLVTASKRNTIMVKGRAVEEELISGKNLRIYRREIGRRYLGEFFGIRCAFYFEVHNFQHLAGLFGDGIREDLLDGVVAASKRSEYFEQLPHDGKLSECIGLFEKFKRELRADPIDWDVVRGIAADLLDAFQLPPNESYSEEEVFCPELETDPSTRKRLLALHAKLSKWKAQSGPSFYTKDFGRAKKAYDSCMQDLIISKRKIIPEAFPRILTPDNFPYVYDLLNDLHRCELERGQLMKARAERIRTLKFEIVRRCLEEETQFCQWMIGELMEKTQYNEIPATDTKAVEFAICHSTDLTEDYKKRILTLQSRSDVAVACAVRVDEDEEEDEDESVDCAYVVSSMAAEQAYMDEGDW